MSRYSSYGHTRHRGDAPLWPLFAILGVIILVAFLHNLYQKYRRNKIREYCFKNGLDYFDDPTLPLAEGLVDSISSFILKK